MSLLLASLALTAQAAAMQPPAFEPYRAVGVSPLWLVTITPDAMAFERNGQDTLNIVPPPRQETEIGHVHWTRDFEVSVEHASCTDPLTRRIFSDRVTVRVGAIEYAGCGGRALSPALPTYDAAGGEPFWWLEIADGRIVFQIDDRSVIAPAPRPFLTGRRGSYFYRTAQLVVRVRRQDCELEDGRIYADAVTVTAGGRTVQGCGGAVVREAPDD